ncbi:hypothetical protein ACL02S_05275 [Nocardia sp. 004]|uniref:hypothetical protein n=1 Tax=Nocardia sp. 004 TaxID=3385978 RepID=UPI0039A1CCDD
MSRFNFRTDAESEDFFMDVAWEMEVYFEISEEEAITRIKNRFHGQEIIGLDIIYHETVEFWAEDIMYGHSGWWQNEADAKPLPLPDKL